MHLYQPSVIAKPAWRNSYLCSNLFIINYILSVPSLYTKPSLIFFEYSPSPPNCKAAFIAASKLVPSWLIFPSIVFAFAYIWFASRFINLPVLFQIKASIIPAIEKAPQWGVWPWLSITEKVCLLSIFNGTTNRKWYGYGSNLIYKNR